MSGGPSADEPTATAPECAARDLERIAQLLQEERSHRFPYFTSATAFELGVALRARYLNSPSESARNPVLISISAFTGATLFQCAAGGDPPDVADLQSWLNAKRNTVRRFGHSSAFVESRLSASGRRPEELGIVWPEYAAQGGGFPIYLKNAPAAPLGAIVVAGLPQNQDHQLIVDTLADFIPRMPSAPTRAPGTYGPSPVLSPPPGLAGASSSPRPSSRSHRSSSSIEQYSVAVRPTTRSPSPREPDPESGSSTGAGEGDDEEEEEEEEAGNRRWY